jgi:3-phenylpropionate/trans-cinnamate dioxygenase ferredoxin reductase component
MSLDNCVIIGASHAGVSLALQLRKEGWTGGIQLIGAETELPYHRPPLSKDLLAGEKTLDGIRLRPEKIYADNAIELLLGCEVVEIDRSSSCVRLKDGRELSYSKLALCTGAVVRALPQAGQQQNIFYIRTAADTAKLSASLGAGKKAVIIGAGYIGLEAAAQLVQKGVQVNVLEVAERILNRVTAPDVSAYFTALHRKHGVIIDTGVTVTALEGEALVKRVLCSDGKAYEADIVIVGIGILPNVELAERAGLTVEQGIVVDEFACTSDPRIFAAGDCTWHPSALYGRQQRLESVQNANDQARVAAANICGKQVSYDAVPWFWSDQYATKLQTAGVNAGFDQAVTRGDITDANSEGFAVFYCQAGRVLAVDCINRPKEFLIGKRLVQGQVQVDTAALMDESFDLAGLL